MDTVFIRELRIDTLIGIHDYERQGRQPIVLDIDMAWDNRPAAQGDDIALTLDYQKVSERLIDYVGNSEFLLVETLAERCADLLREEFSIPWLRLRLSKPDAIDAADAVGVEIERGRS